MRIEELNPDDFIASGCYEEMTAGDALRCYREASALSQNKLAELTGISQTAISAIENGRQKLGVERAMVFARVLNVHPGLILFPGWSCASNSKADQGTDAA